MPEAVGKLEAAAMQGFEIRLRGDGMFEPVGREPAARVGRVTEPHPGWAVMRRDWTGVKWRADDVVHGDLGGALGDLAHEAGAHDWRVVMPDGVAIRRPTRVSLEQVLASMGWVYVDAFIGYAMLRMPHGSSAISARRAVHGALRGLAVHVGDVDLSDSDASGAYWCADICIEVGGFMRMADIEVAARSAFRIEGVSEALLSSSMELVDGFDYRTCTPTTPGSAEVIPFPMDRVRRSAA